MGALRSLRASGEQRLGALVRMEKLVRTPSQPVPGCPIDLNHTSKVLGTAQGELARYTIMAGGPRPRAAKGVGSAAAHTKAIINDYLMLHTKEGRAKHIVEKMARICMRRK